MFFRRSFSISSKNTIAQIPLAQNPLAQIPPAPQVGRLNRPRCALWRRNSQTWVPLRSRKLTKSQVVSFSRETTNRNFKSPSGIFAVNTWRTRPMKCLPSKRFRRQITKAGGFFQNRLPKAARETQSPCQCMLRAATFHRAILRPLPLPSDSRNCHRSIIWPDHHRYSSLMFHPRSFVKRPEKNESFWCNNSAVAP